MADPSAAASGLECVLRAVLDVSRQVEEADVLRTAVLAAHAHLGFDRVGLWLLSNDGTALLTRYGHERELVEYDGLTIPAPTKGLLLDLLDGRVDRIQVDDYKTLWADRLHPLMHEVDHWCAAALRSPAGAFGYISADNLFSRRPIGDEQVQWLVLFAQHVANAIRLARELAARRDTADALREQQQLLRTVMEKAPVMLFMTDAEGLVRFSDGAGLALIGRRPGQAVGQSIFDLYRHVPAIDQAQRRAFAGEFVTATAPIGDYTFEGRLTPIVGEDGAVEGVIGLVLDITDLARTQRELLEAKDRAEQADQAKGLFLSLISHEVRTPLSGVLAMCDLALGSDLGPEQRRWIRAARGSAEWLGSVLDEIIDYTRGVRGELILDLQPFSLAQLLDETMQAVAPPAYAKGLELGFRIDPQVADRRLGDPHRFRQIISNLVGNAIKYTDRGEVLVSVHRDADDADRLVVQVIDSGPGIPPEQQARIFEPFDRGVLTGRSGGDGTGLGLSIARQLAELMGGGIELSNRAGEGSVFTARCRLPLAPDQSCEPPPPALRGRRAVVLHDNALVGCYLVEQLAALGLRADLPDNPRSWTVPAEAPPDLLVIDADLGGGQGWAVARRLVGATAGDAPPVILLVAATAHGELGAWPYQISKPVGPPALRRAVTEALGCADLREPANSVASRRVLIVDDNAAGREMAAVMLRRRGHQAVVAANAAEAVAVAGSQPLDAVLLDLNMPGTDGIALAGMLRDRGLTAPLLGFSAYPREYVQADLDAAGFSGFLAKPFRSDQLYALIESAVRP